MKKKVLIVTGGSLERDLLEDYLQKDYDYIIAADRGISFFQGLKRQPDYILGDFDSADESVIRYYRETKIEMKTYPKEKDETDTHLAVLRAIEVGAKKITILGGMGTRFDHSFANIGLLALLLGRDIEAEVVDRQNRISMLAGGKTRKIKKSEQYGDYISLISFSEVASKVSLKGFLYPLHERNLEQGSSLGISNEIIEDEGEIFFEEGILIIVESRD